MAGRIVVGVDGSDGAMAALHWAYEEARARDATVVAVNAWHYPNVADISAASAYAVAWEAVEQAARETLDRSIESAGPPPRAVRVEPVLAQGGAATVLLETADGADLLVVGSRGRGGFAGLLLGSVSQQCAHHARGPVVIVPTPSDGS